MHRSIYTFSLLILFANLLTANAFAAVALHLPPCPGDSTRFYAPDAEAPKWAGCKDKQGLYQGFLTQYSGQTEILRVAGIKDSMRDGREIRFGKTGTLEERNFKGGHLNGKSFIFKTDQRLSIMFPKTPTLQDWNLFTSNSDISVLKGWLKNQEPITTLDFIDGRLSRLQAAGKDYHFKVSKDGRMFAEDHPEMKNLFFIDTEPLWVLNAADMKLALQTGFGSCKKYAGPISRFGRHYDHLLYKRETSYKKHLAALKEIQDRFIQFCVPEDIRDNLGVLECPPQLPTISTAPKCVIPVSDQLHIPYLPKFFAYEFTLGRPPDEVHEIFREHGVAQFASKYDAEEQIIDLTKKASIQVRRGPTGIIFRPLEKDDKGVIKIKKLSADADQDWYEWKRAPGF